MRGQIMEKGYHLYLTQDKKEYFSLPTGWAPLYFIKTDEATITAYSDVNRPPIPIQIGHLFRSNPAGHSEANRPPSN